MSTQNVVGNDSLLDTIPPWQLNRLGYINYGPANPKYLPNKFHERQDALGTGAYVRETVFNLKHDNTSVHPLFEERVWCGLQQGDYDLLLPSLRLASRFLDDPVILTFFKGLLERPLPRLNDLKLEAACKRNLYRFDKCNLDTSGIDVTWKTMWRLSDCIDIGFHPGVLNNICAETYPSARSGLSSLAANGWSATMYLNAGFLEVLKDHSTASHMSRLWRPGTEPNSAVVRTQFLLAITLVHEICHALWLVSVPDARTDYELRRTTEKYPLEPFWRDHRLAELGSEFENQFISGAINSIGSPSNVAAPFGVYIHRWPGITNTGGPNKPDPNQRGSPAKWGVEWDTRYPVEMKYILSLFDNDIWDRVERFGVRELRPERKLGVRICLTALDLQQFPPESPTIHVPQSPDSQRSTSSDLGKDGVVRPGKYRVPRP